MRLWHEALLPYLPRQQLLGAHRECCALRGAGWGRRHSVVNYVFTHMPDRLIAYHFKVMDEMIARGYNPDPIWRNINWRGSRICEVRVWADKDFVEMYYNITPVYAEHDAFYLKECIDNLARKGIDIE